MNIVIFLLIAAFITIAYVQTRQYIGEPSFAIAGWGNDGVCCEADELIASGKLHYLELNENGSAKHPLYIKADTQPESFA